MKDLNINVQYITRVEGHGNILVNAKDGKIEKICLEISEAPRFFEGFMVGRPWYEISHISCRICGICSVGHSTASIRATEEAFGVVPSEQTIMLRKLNLFAEFIQSHILHLYFLSVPDFLNATSAFALIPNNKEAVLRGLKLKKLANDFSAMICGRHVHNLSQVVGGYTKIPNKTDIENILSRLEGALPDLEATVELFKTIKIPEFERETEYISLQSDDEYALYDGFIYSSDTGRHDHKDYRSLTNEFCVPHSTAKHAKANRDSYLVGALARVNNNFQKLSPLAKSIASELNFKPPVYNPYHMNTAQLIETAHCFEESIKLLSELLKKGLKDEKPNVKPKAGTGVGAVEVPRGILYHEYTYDSEGILVNANCVIPTGQNLENIELDMKKLVPEIIDKENEEEITKKLEMLVRAYDPCISCSTHLLDVEFKN